MNGFTFTTPGFSEYVLRYTVECHNGDEEVVIEGGSQILLSTLIEQLGLTRADGTAFTVDEVESVSFAEPELFTVEEVENGAELTLNEGEENEETVTIETEHDFVITSEQPFDQVAMTLTLTDGEVIEVSVTDAQTVTIRFYEMDGTTPTTPSLGGFNYVVRNNNNNVTEIGSLTVNSDSVTIGFDQALDNGFVATLVQYNGTPTTDDLSAKWWYDETGTLSAKQQISDSFDLGAFSVTKQGDGTYKAVKKDAYNVTLNFIDNITERNPITPGQDGHPAITDTTYVGAHVRDEDGNVIGYAITKMPTNGSSNSVIFDKVYIFGGADYSDHNQPREMDYADAKALYRQPADSEQTRLRFLYYGS